MLTGPEVGLPAGEGVWRPSPVVLADGRIRLYYATIPPPSGPPSISYIFSAISSDGLHFTPEPGQRWPAENDHIERLPDGRWRLYYTHRDSSGTPDGIASAISTDGLSFTGEPGLRLSGSPQPGARVLSCCGIVKLADGRFRMYVSTLQFQPGPGNPPPPVYSAVSSDLAAWTLEPGVRLTGAWNPAALVNPDGSIMLVASQGVGGGTMQTASSPDGLTFPSPSKTNLSGRDPAFVTLPDRRLLMYYDTGDPSTINAAIAVRVTAPTVSYPSPAATAITATSARVSALVDPDGAATTYAFDYGTSTAYGESTGLTELPATGGQQAVSATLAGLSPATTYHFSVAAYNSVGNTDGADQSFTTATCRLRPARDHGWEIALAHATTRAAEARMLRRAGKAARAKAFIERDGCTDYETAIAGLTRKGAAAVLRRAKRFGFHGAARERT